MGLFDFLFGDNDDKYEEAEQRLTEAEQRAQKLQAPYREAGLTALPSLQQLAGQQPASVINQILSQYRESPFAKWATKSGIDALRNVAEARGMLGTPSELQDITRFAETQAMGGQQQFLQDVLGERSRQAGILQNIFGTGAGTAGEMARGTLGIGELQARLAQQAAQEQAQQRQAFLGSLLGGLGGLATGGLMGGAGLLTMPAATAGAAPTQISGGLGAALGFLRGL